MFFFAIVFPKVNVIHKTASFSTLHCSFVGRVVKGKMEWSYHLKTLKMFPERYKYEVSIVESSLVKWLLPL